MVSVAASDVIDAAVVGSVVVVGFRLFVGSSYSGRSSCPSKLTTALALL